MKNTSRNLGWLGVLAAIIWLYYDIAGRAREAIYAGWVTVGLIAAHILTVKRR